MSSNINRLQSIYNGLTLNTANLAAIRSTKKSVHDAIHTSLTNNTSITDATFFTYKQQKTQLDQQQTLSTPPHEFGTFFDLTTFTDPGDGFEYYPYMFGKTLRHNSTTGFVRKDDVDSILNVVKYNDADAIAGITYHAASTRKIEGLFSSNGILAEGQQIFTFGISNALGGIDSKTNMFEILEVYAENLSRDQPFHASFWERSETLTGTATPTASITLTGSGTQFTTDESNGLLAIGDAIEVDGQVREIATIVDATTLTVTKAFEVGSSSSIKNISRKTLTGSIDPGISTVVIGVSTAFLTEVALGDRIVVSGETRTVITISDDTHLTIDVAFSDNANDTAPKVLPLIGNLVKDLNKYVLDSNATTTAPQSKGSFTLKTIFRGEAEDELYGPYISQLLYKSFQYSNLPILQKYNPDMDPSDVNKANKMSVWLDVQRGLKGFRASLTDLNTSSYMHSPRMLGSCVHNDPLFSAFYNAALILNQSSVGVTGLPVHSSTWIDAGPPCILGMVADVAERALRVSWYFKYNQTMKIRPEVFAQRITFASQSGNTDYLDGGANPVPKLSTIKTNAEFAQDLLDKVNDWNVAHGGDSLSGKNYYLNGQYEEGSPTHPATPAGHAVIAGACCTVLKATIITRVAGTDAKIAWVAGPRTALQADITGENLISYAESDASSMTVIGEINKLASNMSIGRNIGGVHYRCDGMVGMKVGEDYAISYLQDRIKEFGTYPNGLFTHFDLTKFDGSRVYIYADRVVNI